jgi:hypothetical protein
MTYVNLLEYLATSEIGIEELWKLKIKEKDRKEAGETIKKFIIDNFQLQKDWRSGKTYFDPRKYTNKITRKKAEEIFEFFFCSTKLIYKYE